MRILLTAITYPVSCSRYIFWALRRMGHEVVVAGAAPGPWLPWAEHRNLEEFEWKPDVAFVYNGEKQMIVSSEDVLSKLSRPPDLLLQMDIKFSVFGKMPCPNVLYAVDNHVGPYGAYEEFDHIFLAHSWGYMGELKQSEWLPCAHDPEHQYVIREDLPRPIDVAMIGVGYPQRKTLVNALSHAGVNVVATTGPIYGDYNLIYNQAKIALVKSACGDLPMRVFENMAQGCLVVADKIVDMERAGFKEDYHYLGYDSIDECVETIKGALTMYDAVGVQSMIGLSRQTVKSHTWEARAQHILDTVFNAS